MKNRIFFDMDGTMAESRPTAELEDMYKAGYFLYLGPYENIVEAARMLCRQQRAEVFTLSAVLSDSPYVIPEKDAWLDKHLPCVDRAHRIYCPTGERKDRYVPGGIRRTDILVDDYSKNLMEWVEYARGVKLLNGINGTKGTWTGPTVSRFAEPYDIAAAILRAGML